MKRRLTSPKISALAFVGLITAACQQESIQPRMSWAAVDSYINELSRENPDFTSELRAELYQRLADCSGNDQCLFFNYADAVAAYGLSDDQAVMMDFVTMEPAVVTFTCLMAASQCTIVTTRHPDIDLNVEVEWSPPNTCNVAELFLDDLTLSPDQAGGFVYADPPSSSLTLSDYRISIVSRSAAGDLSTSMSYYLSGNTLIAEGGSIDNCSDGEANEVPLRER